MCRTADKIQVEYIVKWTNGRYVGLRLFIFMIWWIKLGWLKWSFTICITTNSSYNMQLWIFTYFENMFCSGSLIRQSSRLFSSRLILKEDKWSLGNLLTRRMVLKARHWEIQMSQSLRFLLPSQLGDESWCFQRRRSPVTNHSVMPR